MSRTLTGIVKAGYSPHEQYSSDSRLQGPWSDLYALGGTLYRAVTGQTPEEATLRVDEDHMPPAAQAAKGAYRPGFLAAIDACLKVRHSERPQSVAQLRPMLFGRPVWSEACAGALEAAPARQRGDVNQEGCKSSAGALQAMVRCCSGRGRGVIGWRLWRHRVHALAAIRTPSVESRRQAADDGHDARPMPRQSAGSRRKPRPPQSGGRRTRIERTGKRMRQPHADRRISRLSAGGRMKSPQPRESRRRQTPRPAARRRVNALPPRMRVELPTRMRDARQRKRRA